MLEENAMYMINNIIEKCNTYLYEKIISNFPNADCIALPDPTQPKLQSQIWVLFDK